MSKQRIIVGIDVGARTVRTVVATVAMGSQLLPQVIGVGVARSGGLRKGAIVDVSEAVAAITASVEEAERMSGEPIHHASISVGGSHLTSQNSHGVIAIGSTAADITPADTARAIEAAEAMHIPANQQILRSIPREFKVDEQTGIQDPTGMTGVRMEVDAHIIFALKPALQNVEKAIHQSGVDIDELIPTPLAAAAACIDKRQKELGVVCIDIGQDSTSISVFEDGAAICTQVLPLGGASVTNDIAIGLKTAIDTAEKLKIEHGTCQPTEVAERESIDLSQISRADSHAIEKKELARIIAARYEEIFDMVNDVLKDIDRNGQLPAGAIISGGAAKCPGLLDLARAQLALPVAIGFPKEIDSVIEKLDDPSFAVAAGLVLESMRARPSVSSSSLSFSSFKDAASVAGGFFRRLLP